MMGLLLIVLLFVTSLILTRDKNSIKIAEMPGFLITTTTAAQAEPATILRTTTTSRITTTTDPRVAIAKRRLETELYCTVEDDCWGKEHPLCNGFWTCEKNACMWYCWA